VDEDIFELKEGACVPNKLTQKRSLKLVYVMLNDGCEQGELFNADFMACSACPDGKCFKPYSKLQLVEYKRSECREA